MQVSPKTPQPKIRIHRKKLYRFMIPEMQISTDMPSAFGATIGWVTAFNNQIVNENLTLASTSASYKNSILRSMEAIFASLGE